MSSTHVLGTQTCDDPVALRFMSDANVEYLHEQIIGRVAADTDGALRIGRQSDTELLTIMRAIYIQESRHLPVKQDEQVALLNEAVLKFAVPQIISEARSHAHYLRDRNQSRRGVAPRSIYTSRAGLRSEVSNPTRDYFHPGVQ